MTAGAPGNGLPAQVLPADADALWAAGFASQAVAAAQAVGAHSAEAPMVAPLLDALAQVRLALQAADPAAIGRQVGWWGRLWGRDVALEDHAQRLYTHLDATLLRADAAAQALAAQCDAQRAGLAQISQAAGEIEGWAQAARELAGQASAAGNDEVSAALQRRAQHLEHVAALRRFDAAHGQGLQEQSEQLLAHYRQIAQVLLPAWRQSAQARAAAKAASKAAPRMQASALLAELDALQARLQRSK